MRRQYHTRLVDNRRHVWDVVKLLDIAADVPTESMSLTSIAELDEAFWFSGDGNVPTCRAVAQHAAIIAEVDLAFPILVDPDGRVLDGMHRVCKALLSGQSSIAAKRLRLLPPPDFIDPDLDALEY